MFTINKLYFIHYYFSDTTTLKIVVCIAYYYKNYYFCDVIIHPHDKQRKMNIENTASQMRKGVLEFCILSVIKSGEVYPSEIIDAMKAANLNLLEGTLYPLLTRLKNAELLNYRWVESTGGPPRKYFSLTEKGLTFYKELEATWNELANAVDTITSENK